MLSVVPTAISSSIARRRKSWTCIHVTSPQAPKGSPGADPVITEIVRNGLVAVTEEMKTNLMRTAYNMIIYEALDFTVGLFDAQGNTVSIGLGLPMFIRGMSDTIKAKIAHFGDDIEPGDILLTNDAYITGSHLNHMTFTVPIFHEGELVGVLVLHGALAGRRRHAHRRLTRDIYSEGLQMPIVKMCARRAKSTGPARHIAMNIRPPTAPWATARRSRRETQAKSVALR